MLRFVFVLLCVVNGQLPVSADDGNGFPYRPECDPWSPWHQLYPDTAKLVTPEWVGEDGVEAVIVLAIDDMRDPAKYEQYLRPILNRLKQIDGRAPVSIMTCEVKPDDPQLQSWLGEGLSIECHTIDHPCPILQGGDFAKAKSTYDRCVDLMGKIPGNSPVAFRTPCCDSLNTVSPRFFAEIFDSTTENGKYLQIDSSVFTFFTSEDESLPRELVLDANGKERFLKYMPRGNKTGNVVHNNFVNYIKNYPYPYVINNTCWEIPCIAPSDWSAQHLHGINNPVTVDDWKAAIDLTVHKQGCFSLVFHPHGWIKPEQVVEMIDHAVAKHGKKVKFLTFKEVAERLNRSQSSGETVRSFNDGIGKADDKGLISFFLLGNRVSLDDRSIQHILESTSGEAGLRFIHLESMNSTMAVVTHHGQTSVWLRSGGPDVSADFRDWKGPLALGDRILPPLVREDGSNNGFFFHDRHLCWQNEDTAHLPDLIHRVSFDEILAEHKKASGPGALGSALRENEHGAQEQNALGGLTPNRSPVPVGAAVVDITPDYPVRLTGYGSRMKESEGVAARIHARALVIGGTSEQEQRLRFKVPSPPSNDSPLQHAHQQGRGPG